jgi:hypothetical protein
MSLKKKEFSLVRDLALVYNAGPQLALRPELAPGTSAKIPERWPDGAHGVSPCFRGHDETVNGRGAPVSRVEVEPVSNGSSTSTRG